jgi:FdhD protein
MFSSLTELAQRRPIDNKAALAASAIPPLMRWLQTVSATHKSSGGVHTAALSENGATPVVFFDDIGRHTAVDKVIGAALLAGRAFGPCSLLCSGRISSEILFKARRSGIPVIVSIGSVTHQAVLLARSMGLTLAGFARGESFTLYSHPERITRE